MKANLFGRYLQPRRSWIPYFVLTISLLFTTAATYYVSSTVQNKERLRFENDVQTTQAKIQDRIEAYITLLRAGSGLFAASETVTSQEFRAFLNRMKLRGSYPGIQGIGYSARVPAAAKDAFVTQMRQQGIANFNIRPNYPRLEYHAIIYLEPQDRRNRVAVGYDMFSEPVRRAAMERARDTGIPAASGKVTLVQEIDKHKQAGFLIYVPVYRGGNIPATKTQRQTELMGFIYSPFRADDLMNGIFGDEDRLVNFEIYDSHNVSSANLLHSSRSHTLNNRDRPQFQTHKKIDLGGRTWSLVFTSRPELELASDIDLAPFVAFIGVAMSMILFAMTHSLSSSRKAAERSAAALTESEKRFRRLVESNIFGVAFGNFQGKIHYANDYFLQLIGYEREDLLAGRLHWDSLTPAEFLPLDLQAAEELKKHGIAAPFEKQYIRKDGTRVPILIGGALLADTNTPQPEIIGFILDLSDRKAAQEALRWSEERYRSLVEATTNIIWDTKAEGEVVTELPGWSAFTGQKFEEYQRWGWIAAIHPEDRDRTAQAWLKALAHRSVYEMEHRVRRYDGEYRYMNARGVPVLETDGSVREWIGVHTDITERKQAEVERERLLQREKVAREEAETANRIKDEFLATLSHELRTPLNAMLGWTQLLRNRKFNEETTARALETIDRNTKSLAQLIEDILDMSRIVTGKLHLEIRTIDIVPVIVAAIETVLPAATAKNIQIESKLDSSIGSVMGDANRLQQVFWNLLANAVKFTPRDGRIEVRLFQFNSQVQVQVADNGQGISPEFLPHVFDRFLQADSTTTREYGGLGLGLSIVRQLVELHGGTVGAESAGLGKGATFTVALPIRAVDYNLNEPEQPHSQKEETAIAPPSLKGLRIVVVDDEADARDLLNTVLTQYGAKVVTRETARETIEAIAQFQPHVLVSDIGMPEEDGYALIHRLRQLPPEQGGQIPAIALTAYARTEDRDRALAAGFQQHIAKPVNPDKLAAVVSELARKVTSGW
ncbi:CHASE domain-containing protein [Chroococcidiopsis sp. CCALA 051]|uniref:CHASE domain-containing protein n=1 Tax=Chroococcidiopsis sp. CCALA 051 TaxID=869949 RepID=UPI001304E958|nr:CHASE domain-containing protein [Chroococcidiopsis sp. CCALA 051]